MNKKFIRIVLLGLSILVLLAACGEAGEVSEGVICGPGTVEESGACIPDDGLTCGAGTHEENGACVPADGLTCGENTQEVNGSCVADEQGVVCGAGTVEEEGVCLPTEGLVCGAGTVEQNGSCVAEVPDDLLPPEVTVVSGSQTMVEGQIGAVSFHADVDHSWQLEVGGYYRGGGEFLDAGTGTADSLVSVAVDADADELGIGDHRLRLYVFVEQDGLTATASVEINLSVRGDLDVLIWGRGANSVNMVRDVIELDPRVGSTETRIDVSSNPPPPTLDFLTEFDVVVFGWRGTTVEATGNVIAQYIEAGGAMVVWPYNDEGWPTGNWTASNYAPLLKADSAPYSTTDDATIGSVQSGHPILDGVTSLNVGWRPIQDVDDDAEVVASWSDGNPLVAIKGPVVALGWRLSTDDPAPGGDWQTLLTNSIVEAVGNIEP
jgi:hypothetical protein